MMRKIWTSRQGTLKKASLISTSPLRGRLRSTSGPAPPPCTPPCPSCSQSPGRSWSPSCWVVAASFGPSKNYIAYNFYLPIASNQDRYFPFTSPSFVKRKFRTLFRGMGKKQDSKEKSTSKPKILLLMKLTSKYFVKCFIDVSLSLRKNNIILYILITY